MKKRFIILLLILFVIFLIFYYIFSITGNNTIKKSNEEIIENIFRDDFSYTAEIEVKIYSNKNENEYRMKQKEDSNYSFQEVISEGDMEGLVTEYKENKLILKNTKLNLQKIYEDYKEITNNYLFLKTFIKEYEEIKETVKLIEKEEEIVVNIELKNPTKYIRYKTLYINKNTGKPTRLVIKNSAKQEVACIEYIIIEEN